MGVQRLNVLGAVIEESRCVIHLTLGFVQRLAVLHAQNPADFFPVGLQRITDVLQPFAAGFDGVGAGQAQSRLAGSNGIFHLGLRHGGYFCDHIARRRVVNIKGVALSIIRPATADIAIELFQQW